ncbi:MAG: polysaccharide biosynthesis/export family protein [Rikenellaceae bacterium]
MHRGFRLFLQLAIIALISSCGSYHKQVPYLQNSNQYESNVEWSEQSLYDARIMPKDLITITVSTSDRTVASPFNLTAPSALNLSSYITSQPTLQKYLVDNDGSINFPVVGRLYIGDLTTGEVEEMIVERLKRYFKETPIVTVRLTNYNISVLGEVSNPGVFTIEGEKVTILEALAMAGDMTIYGQRQNIKLVREDVMGERKIVELDITSPDIIDSPYYHLQQNDVLYVTPNRAKSKTAGITSSTTIWFSVITTTVSLATLLVSILL